MCDAFCKAASWGAILATLPGSASSQQSDWTCLNMEHIMSASIFHKVWYFAHLTLELNHSALHCLIKKLFTSVFTHPFLLSTFLQKIQNQLMITGTTVVQGQYIGSSPQDLQDVFNYVCIRSCHSAVWAKFCALHWIQSSGAGCLWAADISAPFRM